MSKRMVIDDSKLLANGRSKWLKGDRWAKIRGWRNVLESRKRPRVHDLGRYS